MNKKSENLNYKQTIRKTEVLSKVKKLFFEDIVKKWDSIWTNKKSDKVYIYFSAFYITLDNFGQRICT